MPTPWRVHQLLASTAQAFGVAFGSRITFTCQTSLQNPLGNNRRNGNHIRRARDEPLQWINDARAASQTRIEHVIDDSCIRLRN